MDFDELWKKHSEQMYNYDGSPSRRMLSYENLSKFLFDQLSYVLVGGVLETKKTMEKDGGSAFPEICTGINPHTDKPDTYSYGGMSLRDYCAAKALQGLLAGDAGAYNCEDAEMWMNCVPEVAKASYAIADAMLDEKNKLNCRAET